MPTYKLTYFDIRGRAEVCRLLFAASDTPYEDVRLTGEEFSKFKPKTPFGQVPVLEVDGKMFGQSAALFTYLAKEFGFYGKTNLDGLMIDQILQQTSDFLTAFGKSLIESDETKKAELTKKFVEEDCPKNFGFFEKILNENKTGYYAGDKLSVADIAVYDIATTISKRFPGAYDKFPGVKTLVEKVGQFDKIKNYVANRPDTEF